MKLKKGTSFGWSLPVLAITGSTPPPGYRIAVTNITARASTLITVLMVIIADQIGFFNREEI